MKIRVISRVSHLISEGWSPGGMRLTANICAASSGLLNRFTNIRNAQTSVADLAFPSFKKQNEVYDCWVYTFIRCFKQMYHLYILNCVHKLPSFICTQSTNFIKPVIHDHYFTWQLLLVTDLKSAQLTKLWCAINNMLISCDLCLLAERQHFQYLH